MLVRPEGSLAIVLVLLGGTALAGERTPDDRCAKAMRTLFGETRAQELSRATPPRIRRSPMPNLPTRPRGACSGMAVHEVLIGPTGKVRLTWPVRTPKCQPPWPELDRAIHDSILDKEYEPAMAAGKAVPSCAMVSITIDWR
jgi:hypothetical protein